MADVWTAPNQSEWEKFMGHDHSAESRSIAYQFIEELVSDRRGVTLVEVGFGDARDFKKFFRKLHKTGTLVYSGRDGSKDFVWFANQAFPKHDFAEGHFDDLRPLSYDIAYTRHTLQHQSPEMWRECLSHLLGAAREACVIGWRLPPGEDECIRFSGTWQNSYRRADALKVIEDCGFILSREWRGGDDAVWLLSRKA